MAYGVDVPTEVGYVYSKKYNVEIGKGDPENDTPKLIDRNDTYIPHLKTVLWENPHGALTTEATEVPRGSIADVFVKKKPKREAFNVTNPAARLPHSGDGSVPYMSLSWAHTWLLHAARARRFTEDKYNSKKIRDDVKNALDHIHVSHRPRGKLDWVDGPAQEEESCDINDTNWVDECGTDHPHGTRYKPLMKKYHNVGISRTTGIEYTTSVIEAVGVEHKETTRNYDILAAVFTDIVKYMHDDMDLVSADEADDGKTDGENAANDGEDDESGIVTTADN
eukprot:CAMPEP_0178741792 /NCGR_PEP_ID=MMETSP0744-20121128/5334_1 /TAXON_ID=913974 /ORGANISM="Nitzschia punctata, Strain CCMP561" /LENGTH=279 /DNA_ID=CAMNT_0020394699 /DNA_START=68 /DNA_END=907 /DNA_ORIENTATION=-